MDKFLFIAGMAKCGTTALAQWLRGQGIAEYLIPGVKEPFIFSRFDFDSAPIKPAVNSNLWRMDASVGYALNEKFVYNLPKESTRIILCFRNPWKRVWSNYRMLKLGVAEKGGFLDNYYYRCISGQYAPDGWKLMEPFFIKESERFMQSSIEECIDYELGFLFTHGTVPFYSILDCSRYKLALRNIARKYSADDIFPVSIHILNNDGVRRNFTRKVLDYDFDTEPVAKKFSFEGSDIGEGKPDFSSTKFDKIRSIFAFEIKEFEALFPRFGICSEFIDFDELRENVF